MIGAANINGKVANKKELQGYVTVPNKVVWDKEKIAEVEQAAQDKVNAAEAKAAQDIAAAAAENEKKLAAKDKECEAKIEEVKYQMVAGEISFIDENGILSDANIYKIGVNGFYRNQNLKVINLPNCTEINDNAFCSNKNLITINMENLNTTNGQVFYSLNKNLKEINLPNLRKINGSFLCTTLNMEELTFEKLESINRTSDKNGFLNSGSEAIVKKINLPSLKELLGQNIDAKCTSLYLPKLIQSTWMDNKPIEGSLNGSICEYNNKLENVYLESDIRYIGAQIFFYSKNLKRLIINNKNKVPTLGASYYILGNNVDTTNLTIYVPRAMVEQYKAATNWSAYNIAAIEDNRAELQGIFTELDELEGWG